ncbi:MAG: hypothetical protein IPK18_01375 [Sphingobacteriales bacterium]|nr:MAG: hypothetical protein IPK18_01375 [Sphingobacteriales bacterium]
MVCWLKTNKGGVIFPMLPKAAVLGITQVLRVNGGIQIDLNMIGNKAVKVKDLVFADNSIIYVKPIGNILNIYSPGNKIYFGQDLVDFNIYISGNSWSIYKDFNKSFKF